MGLGNWAQAKVFSFQNRSFAAFVRGTGGMTNLDQDAFVHSSGSSSNFGSEGVKYSFSGELGGILMMGPVNLRFGAEAIRPKTLSIDGANASGTNLFTLTSNAFVFNPNITIEYVYSGLAGVRFSFFAGAGYAMVSLDNKYEFTSTGLTTYSPVTDYTETSSATVYEGHAGFAFETLFADNVTFAMDFGYRYLPVRELKYKNSETTIQGAAVAGQTVLNADGSNRSIDLSGITIGAAFRFYIQ